MFVFYFAHSASAIPVSRPHLRVFFQTLLVYVLVSDDRQMLRQLEQTEGTRSSHRYALIASDCPFLEQDVLFRSVDDMRVNFYLFREWVLDLFGRWAPLDSAPLGDDANVCSWERLRAYCLEEPGTAWPGANSVTHFWLAAWWRRLYGPLVPFEQLFRYLPGFTDCNTRSLLSVGARLGPGQFGYIDPADYCRERGMRLSTCGAQYARCI